MITAYRNDGGKLRRLAPSDTLSDAIWVDLYSPLPAELAEVSAATGAELPTREDMAEIELSSRLYAQSDTAYMTIVLPAVQHDQTPQIEAVGFVLTPDRLVTLRHTEPQPFSSYPQRSEYSGVGCASSDAILAGLMAEIVARFADVLEHAGRDLEEMSRAIFRNADERRAGGELRGILKTIGGMGDLVGDVGACMITLERALGFLGQLFDQRGAAADLRRALTTQLRDVTALAEHVGFLDRKVGLMLDATLGMISIEQNATIKIFSVLAVVFLPPTLIASIYGMNFAFMPELGWRLGYPFALILMIASAAGTYSIFRIKGWL